MTRYGRSALLARMAEIVAMTDFSSLLSFLLYSYMLYYLLLFHGVFCVAMFLSIGVAG